MILYPKFVFNGSNENGLSARLDTSDSPFRLRRWGAHSKWLHLGGKRSQASTSAGNAINAAFKKLAASFVLRIATVTYLERVLAVSTILATCHYAIQILLTNNPEKLTPGRGEMLCVENGRMAPHRALQDAFPLEQRMPSQVLAVVPQKSKATKTG
jgi:hypothetical protein